MGQLKQINNLNNNKVL